VDDLEKRPKAGAGGPARGERRRWAFWRSGLAGLALSGLPGVAAAADSPGGVRDRLLRITDLFDTSLPGTVGRRNVALYFMPRMADFRDREYIRLPFDARYGVGEEWELTGGVAPFIPNPFQAGPDHRWGPGELKLGVRRDLGRLPGWFDETTAGFEIRSPVGKPPTRLNDHHTHLKPFVAATRNAGGWPDTMVYANLSYDHSVRLWRRGPIPPEVVRRNVVELVPGLLYQPGPYGVFAEYRVRRVAENSAWYLTDEARVGLLWDVPLARSEKWRLPGKWQVELVYKHEFSTTRDREPDQGPALRVNWRTKVREVLASPKP
jgi:hypothetical protein